MRIGVLREIKDGEDRVALTPDGATRLIEARHAVAVERGAGEGAGFTDADYAARGARIVDAGDAWACELVLKVKEPVQAEYPRLRDNILFTFLHLAGIPAALTDALLEAGTSAIAYETVADEQGRLPLLAPMSAVAGNVAANVGCYFLSGFHGGRGILPGQVTGRPAGKVMVIGDGVVGQHAARVLAGTGTRVYMFSLGRESFDAMRYADPSTMTFVASSPASIAAHIRDADLVIGAVLQLGARAPHVVTEAMVKSMQPGSVIVDVSIDQGGCVETSRPTSHSHPVYEKHGVIHYCVTNMPGAYPRTSTLALTAATLPYVLRLADAGIDALKTDAGFARGLNTHRGVLTCRPVADAHGYTSRYRPVAEVL